MLPGYSGGRLPGRSEEERGREEEEEEKDSRERQVRYEIAQEVSRMQRFMYSQILCDVLERFRTQHQILFGNNSWIGSKIHHNTELWTRLTENRWNSSGIFPRIHYIAARPRSPKIHEQMSNPDQFQGRTIVMTMFNDIVWAI